jgi:hypothetical protein
MHGGLLLLAGKVQLAFAGNGQHRLFQLHFDGVRIDAGREGIDFHRVWRAADVQSRKAAAVEPANTGRKVEGLLHLLLQAVEFGEQVARIQGSIGHVLLLTSRLQPISR